MHITSLFGQAGGYYDPNYQSYDPAVAAGIFAMVMLIALVSLVIGYVVYSYLLSRIFKKASIKAWKAWVPVYNTWILLELGDQQGFWAVLAFIPIVNIVSAVFMYIAMYHIGLKLGKDGSFVILAIFLPLVWLIWLAVDGSSWKGSSLPKKTETKVA